MKDKIYLLQGLNISLFLLIIFIILSLSFTIKKSYQNHALNFEKTHRLNNAIIEAIGGDSYNLTFILDDGIENIINTKNNVQLRIDINDGESTYYTPYQDIIKKNEVQLNQLYLPKFGEHRILKLSFSLEKEIRLTDLLGLPDINR